MNKILNRFFVYLILFGIYSCSATGDNENTFVLIKTSMGDITLKLYDNTPVHRDNFISLVNSGVYDGVLFHRVIKDFMIQTGDPETGNFKFTKETDSLKSYTIPAEFNSLNFHKKGALAAAREGNEVNPEMRSSGTQFYIVQGVKFTDEELNAAEQRINNNIKQGLFNKYIFQVTDSMIAKGEPLNDGKIQDIASVKMFQYLTTTSDYKIPAEQRETYKTLGGVPRLDGTYTVFGEVTEGLDIVDRIASVQTGNADRPLSDVRIIKARIINK